MKLKSIASALLFAVVVVDGASLRRKNSPLDQQNLGSDIFSERQRRNAKASDRRCNFQCPVHSSRKPTVANSCPKKFVDCECDEGWFKDGDRCAAQEGKCTEEWFEDQVSAKQREVENWIVNAEDDSADPEERYSYLLKMEDDLAQAWTNYNIGLASCQQLEEEGGSDGDDRRILEILLNDGQPYQYRRELFFGAIKRAIQKVVEVFKRVVKKVVQVVVEVVKAVGDIIVELIDCGVGLVTKGAKCGGIGCIFGISGAALDIAFTIATGGVSTVRKTQCAAVDKAEDQVDRNVAILNGISDATCAMNEKFNSPVLEEVCDIKEEADQSKALENSKILLSFLEAFKKAFCGSPGSALADILEQVVVCEVGCAEDENAFCPNKDLLPQNPNTKPNTKPNPIDGFLPADEFPVLLPADEFPVLLPADEFVPKEAEGKEKEEAEGKHKKVTEGGKEKKTKGSDPVDSPQPFFLLEDEFVP